MVGVLHLLTGGTRYESCIRLKNLPFYVHLDDTADSCCTEHKAEGLIQYAFFYEPLERQSTELKAQYPIYLPHKTAYMAAKFSSQKMR